MRKQALVYAILMIAMCVVGASAQGWSDGVPGGNPGNGNNGQGNDGDQGNVGGNGGNGQGGNGQGGNGQGGNGQGGNGQGGNGQGGDDQGGDDQGGDDQGGDDQGGDDQGGDDQGGDDQGGDDQGGDDQGGDDQGGDDQGGDDQGGDDQGGELIRILIGEIGNPDQMSTCKLTLTANLTKATIRNECYEPIDIGSMVLSQEERVVIGSTPDGRYFLMPGDSYVIDIKAHVGILRLTGVGGYGEYAVTKVTA